MSFLHRAFLYGTRKFSKTLLLFLILLVIATMTLSGVAIQGASQTAQLNVHPALGGVFTWEKNQSDSSKWIQKPVGGGSGFGLYLYIVKTILDLHGFGCTIENSDAQVRFTITFA